MKQIEVFNTVKTVRDGTLVAVGTLKIHGMGGTIPVQSDGKIIIDLRENREIKDQQIRRGALPKLKKVLAG